MITENAIQEAIAYYQGKLDPRRDDAVALAACYILQDHMFANAEKNFANGYSYAAPPEVPENYSRQSGENTVGDYGDSEFLRAVAGKDPAAMWAVMDELMETLKMVNERVYNGVMRKIR